MHRRLRTLLVAATLAGAAGTALTGCSAGGGPSMPSVREGSGTSAPATPQTSSPTAGATDAPERHRDPAFQALEKQYGARVGVVALDTGTGETLSYRGDERFAFDSTYKALAAGLLLKTKTAADRNAPVPVAASEIVTHSPVTEQHVGGTMTLDELSEAAIRQSDNTAGNKLLEELGGPAGFQASLRAIGDDTTHSDRTETTLNEATPGDERDTTTPRAFAEDLEAMTAGSLLPHAASDRLVAWMSGNALTDALARAGVSEGWRVADKSGSGGYGSRNDLAVLYPPASARGPAAAPVVLAVFTSHADSDADPSDPLVAAATRAALEALGRA